ncbi:MAG: recombinase RecA, partial [Halobacteria archaeon]|nr:recombinase RecA [Halobacteria archaeon]
IGIPTQKMMDEGTLSVEEIEPLSRSTEEFAAMVRDEVENKDAKVVMIDGTEGYRLSLQGEEDDRQVARKLHSLGRYLKNMGVTVILVNETDSITGEFHAT